MAKPRMLRLTLLLCTAIFTWILACSRGTSPAPGGTASQVAPQLQPVASLASLQQAAAAPPAAAATSLPLKLLGGADLRRHIAKQGAKATFVNVWASWCGSCRHELPMLQALAENLKHDSVRMIIVSVDEPEEFAKAEAFLRSTNITLEAYIAKPPLDAFKSELNPRWPGMIPASFLFDNAGQLRYFWGGEAYEDEIVPVISKFLAGTLTSTEANFALAPGKHVTE